MYCVIASKRTRQDSDNVHWTSVHGATVSGGAGNWSERLLKSLYYVTWQHGDQLLQETEALWQTVARNRRNVIPVLDFLLSRGLQEGASQTTAQVCETQQT